MNDTQIRHIILEYLYRLRRVENILLQYKDFAAYIPYQEDFIRCKEHLVEQGIIQHSQRKTSDQPTYGFGDGYIYDVYKITAKGVDVIESQSHPELSRIVIIIIGNNNKIQVGDNATQHNQNSNS